VNGSNKYGKSGFGDADASSALGDQRFIGAESLTE